MLPHILYLTALATVVASVVGSGTGSIASVVGSGTGSVASVVSSGTGSIVLGL